MTKSQWRMTK